MSVSGSGSEQVVEVQALVKRFGELVAVDGISFAIQRGECVGILGPNGAGKTTTLEILEGLQEATSGEVRVLGRTWAEAPDYLRERLGIQLQETRFRDKLKSIEVVRLFRSFYPSGLQPEAALEMVGLTEKRGAMVGTLSGGQRQRLGLAVSLVADPEIVFLDEPTTGLDPHARRELWELIGALRKKGRTVLLTTHYMEEARALCDRLLIVDRGRIIAQGTPKALVAQLNARAVVELASEAALPEARLRAVDGVLEARGGAHELELSLRDLHSTLPELLRIAAEGGCPLTRLSTREATLDDVFLSITGRTLAAVEAPKAAKDGAR